MPVIVARCQTHNGNFITAGLSQLRLLRRQFYLRRQFRGTAGSIKLFQPIAKLLIRSVAQLQSWSLGGSAVTANALTLSAGNRCDIAFAGSVLRVIGLHATFRCTAAVEVGLSRLEGRVQLSERIGQFVADFELL